MAVNYGSKDKNRFIRSIFSQCEASTFGRGVSDFAEHPVYRRTPPPSPSSTANNQLLPEYNNIATALRRNENKFLSFWTYGNGREKGKGEAGESGGGRILSFRVHLCWQCARVISYFAERQRLLSFVFLFVSSVFSELLSERPKNNVNVNNTHIKSVMKNARTVEAVV